MFSGSDILSTFKKLLSNSTGNFGILTALSLPVLAMAAGIAIDVTNMSMTRSQLQEATDAAALAVATALADGGATMTTANDLANKFVLGQMSTYLAGDTATTDSLKAGTSATVTKTTDSSGNTSYSVVVNASYSMPVNGMTRLTGQNSMNIGASSSANGGKTSETQKSALSMEIALDKSGSMLLNTEVVDTTQTSCIQYYTAGNYLYQYPKAISPCYIKKIAALKTAVGNLLDQLDAADPTSQYVRTAAIAWSSQVDSHSNLDWGTKSTRTNVISGLNAEGGTESSAPMTMAFNSLMSASESAAQAKMNNKTFQKYIVLMTDGENNDSSSDQKTLATCNSAKAAGVQIYTVAFMAPARGQNLLQTCASSSSNYFAAQQMSDLVAAFKTIATETSKQMTLLTK